MKVELIRLALLAIYFTTLAICFPSCEKPEQCFRYTLGEAGETYETIPTNGVPSVIFVENGLIIQEVCK